MTSSNYLLAFMSVKSKVTQEADEEKKKGQNIKLPRKQNFTGQSTEERADTISWFCEEWNESLLRSLEKIPFHTLGRDFPNTCGTVVANPWSFTIHGSRSLLIAQLFYNTWALPIL